jgi:hypothetical protein
VEKGFTEGVGSTWGLLQGWQDIGAMVILSLLCFIWAGQTSLGFCLLTCTFISLISSGSGRTQQLFQPCKQALPVSGNANRHHVSKQAVDNLPTFIANLSYFMNIFTP